MSRQLGLLLGILIPCVIGAGVWWWARDVSAPTAWHGYAEADYVKVGPTQQGLLTSGPDTNDGRKTLISATARGRKLATSVPATREAWLEAVIDKHLSPDEQMNLIQAAQIMERLADI